MALPAQAQLASVLIEAHGVDVSQSFGTGLKQELGDGRLHMVLDAIEVAIEAAVTEGAEGIAEELRQLLSMLSGESEPYRQ